MFSKIILTASSIVISGLGSICAQQTIAASGGNAAGSNGSSSYTVGQIAYHSYSSSAGSVNQGVQQAYEIMTLAASDTKSIEKNITLYPNPVKDVLFVDFNQESYSNASYQLFDVQGKIIREGNLNQKKNELDLSILPQSVYIIRIIQENKQVKSFKIIKK